MTMIDPIETRLRTALAVELSPGQVRRLDARVERVQARSSASRRPAMPRLRWFLRSIPILAALAVVSGSVIGAVGLLDQLVQSPGAAGWRAAWDDAVLLDMEQTDGDVTVTLVRAYADRNQVLVGFTVAGLPAAPTSDAGEPSPLVWTAELIDPTGRAAETWATVRSGSEIDGAEVSASIHTWEGRVAAEAGTWILTFTSVGHGGNAWTPGECDVDSTDPACLNRPASTMVEGTWRFEFDLPAPPGGVLAPGLVDSEGGAAMTLTELRISPTMVSASVALRVDGRDVTAWGSTDRKATTRRDDASLTFTTEYHDTQAAGDRGPLGDEVKFLTAAGAADAAGTWEIEIPEIWYTSGGDGTETRLSGPWTFTVQVP